MERKAARGMWTRCMTHAVRRACRAALLVLFGALSAAPLQQARGQTVSRAETQDSILTGDLATLRQMARGYDDTHDADIVRQFARFLALPNVASDREGIRRNAALLLDMLRERHVSGRLLELGDAPPVVYGELNVPGATHTIILYAHYDGQPVDPSQWATPPWTPTLRTAGLQRYGIPLPLPSGSSDRLSGEARIYARSAGDDKASIMAMLTALDALRAGGRNASVNVKFLFEGEEEAGSPHLLEILRQNRDLLRADVLLLCDGPEHQSGRQQLQFGVRGVTGMELTLYGATRALHSGHYGNWAPNAGVMMANLIASMRDDDGRIRIAHFYDDVAPETSAERAAIAAVPQIDSALRMSLGLAHTEANDAPLAARLMGPALNVRGIAYGNVGARAANVISTEARASFDFRLVPNERPARVQTLVEEHMRRQGFFVTHDSVTTGMRLAHARVASVRWDSGGYPANRTSMSAPISRAVISVARDSAGRTAIVLPTMGGSAPSYMFSEALQVPVIILPIANYDDNQHAANENLRLQNLRNGIEVYAQLLGGLGRALGPAALQSKTDKKRGP